MTSNRSISIERVSIDELYSVQSIFDDLQTYSMYIDGVITRDSAAYEFATALPPGYSPHQKHTFLAKRQGIGIGLLDVLSGYPSPTTAFIGLLAVRESLQGLGVGRALFLEAEHFAREHLKAAVIRLAVVEANPVIGFWNKMGCHCTGEIKPYQGRYVTSRVILMEKRF